MAEVKGIQEFNKSMNGLIEELGLLYQEVYPQEARLLATEFMKRTPPYPGGNAAGSNAKDAQTAGEGTIKHDIVNAITPVDIAFQEEARDKNIAKVIRKKDVKALQSIFDNIPKMKSWRVQAFSPMFHKKYRGKQGSRYHVKDSMKNMTLDKQEHKLYTKSEQKKPGWMKSGWGIAVSMLQGRVPAWITKHFGSAPGGMEMNMADDNPNPYIRVWNNAPTISRFASGYEFAVRERIRTIEVKLKLALDRRLKKNFKTQ